MCLAPGLPVVMEKAGASQKSEYIWRIVRHPYRLYRADGEAE
jgi:hypothetical protein